MEKLDDSKDIRPRPDPTALTTAQLDREIAHLKELMERDRDAEREARKVALDAMDRRLLEMPELRMEIVKVREEYVRTEVYLPAHEALRVQRASDNEKSIALAAQVNSNSSEIAAIKSSLMWLSRLVVGALVLGLIGYAFQRLVGR